MTPYALSAEGVAFQYPSAPDPILRDCSFALNEGERCVVVGPNGCGKSTLLSLLAGLENPTSGVVRLGGEDVATLRRRDCARRVALMPQVLGPVQGLTAKELVAQGRYAEVGALGMLRTSAADMEETMAALDAVGVAHFADRLVDSLSGGERQRVRLALALRQESPLLLLDEPLAHLDLHHQFELLDVVRSVAEQRGLTVLAVLHELDLAVRWADRLLVLNEGRIVADGHPQEVVTADLLSEVFRLEGYVDEEGMVKVQGTTKCDI